jgi:heterodisulfide reductase subunit B
LGSEVVKKYGLFLGCNMPAIRPDVERAIRLTMPKLGVELVDLPGSVCCPAFGTFPSADEIAGLSINAWNLAIAEELEVDLIAECGSCYSSLRLGRDKLLRDEKKMGQVNELLMAAGKSFKGTATVRHMIDVLYNEVGPDKINDSITKGLNGIRAVVQYPCHTLFPSETVGFDAPSGRPHMLRELVEALGAEVEGYSRELQCCGGAGGFTRRALNDATKFTKKKFDAIKKETSADLIIVSCITCLMHLDERQKELNRESKDNNYSIPVFDYNQVLALCMGFEPKEVASISFIPRNTITEMF